jgi:L-lactate dehydrogenase (cytochrome)
MYKNLSRYLSLADFEIGARRHLPKQLYAYVNGGVEDNLTLHANRRVFDDYFLKPSVLVDVSTRDISIDLFGHRYSAPVGIAPMGIAALTGYRGDLCLAQAAAMANVPFVMSGSSLIPLEKVVEAAPNTWFQAYLPGDSAQIAPLIDRVRKAGVQTLVITVDTPVKANRENNVRAGFSTPLRPSIALAYEGVMHPCWLVGTFLRTLLKHGMPHFENNYATRGAPVLSAFAVRDFSGRGHLNWTHIQQIRQQWPGAMVVKGVLNAADAARCKQIGIDGIVVSNHGGRQIDSSVPPLYVLADIVDVSGNMVVMADSGIRRGTDVIKTLALGAKATFVGRPFNYASAVAGQRGVAHAIALIVAEIHRDLGMLGITELSGINKDVLVRR